MADSVFAINEILQNVEFKPALLLRQSFEPQVIFVARMIFLGTLQLVNWGEELGSFTEN